MSDDILKLYQSIAKNSQVDPKPQVHVNLQQAVTQIAPASSTTSLNLSGQNLTTKDTEPKSKPQINYVNINLNDYLNKTKIQLNNGASSQIGQDRGPIKYYDNENQPQHSTENLFKRKREKCSKGLRHFSMKVCEKVKQKGVTTYNQVADELVNEYSKITNNIDFWNYDQKNVRRRVYDALNVLMAMNIISKEKKEIKWIGLPCNKKQECQELEAEKKKKQESIQEKSEILKNLLLEQIANRSIIEHNRNNPDDSNSNSRIQMPFYVINTSDKTQIDVNISSNKSEYLIQFDNTFQINSHYDILNKLNFTNGLDANKNPNSEKSGIENASSMVPKFFEPYIRQLANGDNIEPICMRPELPDFKLETFDTILTSKNLKQSKKIISNNGIAKPSNEDNQLNIESYGHLDKNRTIVPDLNTPSSKSHINKARATNEIEQTNAENSEEENSFDNFGEEDEEDEDEEEEDEDEDEDEEEDEDEDDEENDEDEENSIVDNMSQ